MAERYSRLFTLPENLYAEGAPVYIETGALLKDTQTGKILAQLKPVSLASLSIKAMKVSVYPQDTMGNPLGAKVEHQYLDLTANRGESFGTKSPIVMPDASTRGFTVTVDEVVFSDNSLWQSAGEPWEQLSVPTPISELGDEELEKQFRLKYGKQVKNLPATEKGLRYCVCGALNRNGDEECRNCKRDLTKQERFTVDELCRERDARLADEEQKAAEAKVKAKKTKKIIMILVPILVVVGVLAGVIGNSIKKNNNYETALALLEQNSPAKDDQAYQLLLGLGDYKDAPTILEQFEYLPVRGEYYVSLSVGKDMVSGGAEIEYSYSDDGRIQRIVRDPSAESSLATSYVYYPNGTLRTIKGLRVGTGTYTAYSTWDLYYNQNGEVSKIVYDSIYDIDTFEFSYEYWGNGSIRSIECTHSSSVGKEFSKNVFEFSENAYVYVCPSNPYFKTWALSPSLFRIACCNGEDRGYATTYALEWGSGTVGLEKAGYINYDENGNISEGEDFGTNYICTYDSTGSAIVKIHLFDDLHTEDIQYENKHIYVVNDE